MNEQRLSEIPENLKRNRRVLTGVWPALAVAAALIGGCSDQPGDEKGVTASGSIEARETSLSSGVGGRIVSVSAEEGDAVKKGQVVATLDDTELKAVVQQAKGSLAVAEANLAQVKAYVASAEADPGLGLPGIKRHSVDAARGQVDQAKGALTQAEARLSQAIIAAPADGIVVGRLREVGEFVAPGAPILRVANMDKVWLRVYAHLPTLGRIKIGQTARITTDAYHSRHYVGRVVSISEEPEFTPKNVQTAEERVKLVYAIRISVDNDSRELKPGMPAQAYLEFGRRR